MAIRQRLTDDERDDLTKDVDDLDAAYIEKMRNEGIDEGLVAQFASLLGPLDGTEEDEEDEFAALEEKYRGQQ